MLTILGVNVLGGGALKPWRNKAEKLEEKSLEKFAEKFTGNFPKIHQTKTESSQIRSAEPLDQEIQ